MSGLECKSTSVAGAQTLTLPTPVDRKRSVSPLSFTFDREHRQASPPRLSANAQGPAYETDGTQRRVATIPTGEVIDRYGR
jgi:hypothetical protein